MFPRTSAKTCEAVTRCRRIDTISHSCCFVNLASHIVRMMKTVSELSKKHHAGSLFGCGRSPALHLFTIFFVVTVCAASGLVEGREISYDQHSLWIDDRRLVVLSGKFHYWRLPSPAVWPDVLGKIRAAGYNAVRIVFPWSYHSPAPGVYDFQGIRDVSRLLEECTRQDLYAVDLYPYAVGAPGPDAPAWDTENTFKPLLDQSEGLIRSFGGAAASTPLFMAEFQGGWYDGWGSLGYDAGYDFFGPGYFAILDKSLLGQGFTIMNRYMFYGGTNWGYLANPEVYTSYDYSAPIREWGVLSTKYSAMKRIGMFAEAFPELLAATEQIEASQGSNEETRAFYRVRQSRPFP